MFTDEELHAFYEEALEDHEELEGWYCTVNHSYDRVDGGPGHADFDADDMSSPIVNDCLYWARRRLPELKGNWAWDDPGTLYAYDVDELSDELEDEADQLLHLASVIEEELISYMERKGLS